jgi:hypothetical protein
MEDRQLAALQRQYSLADALSGIRAAHDTLSAALTSLAIRMREHKAHHLPVPLQVLLSFCAGG